MGDVNNTTVESASVVLRGGSFTSPIHDGSDGERDAAYCAAWRAVGEGIANDARYATRWGSVRVRGEWATAAPVAVRLRQLLGPRVALAQAHHNCVMTKDPRYSSLTSWHRDIRYWAFERPELVSVWFALGPERVDNGCLLVIPGTHRMDFAAERLDEAQFLRTDVAENGELLRSQIPVELEPGDVLFFHCRLFHAAGNNRSTQTKFSAVFTYHAADNAALPGTRSAGQPDIPL